MGSRTAISAGILAVSMAALPVAAGPAAAGTADCEHGSGGLLSGVTDGLCDAVGAVTGTVDKLTGGLTEPLTDGLGKTTDKVLGTVGDAVPTARPTDRTTDRPRSSATPATGDAPTAKPKKSLLPTPLDEVCLPGLACEGGGLLEETLRPTPEASARRTAEPEPGREDEERGRRDRRDRDEEETEAVPTTGPTTRPSAAPAQPPVRETHSVREEPVAEEPAADPESLRIDLLWPDAFTERLPLPVAREPVVRPVAPASDVVGTTLTVVLLGTAVLASRVVQQRRRRREQQESIPFEPAGRQRLA